MQVSSSFSSSRPTAPQGLPHGADQHADGMAVATGIPRAARAPPARPDGAGTGGAKKTKHYAVAKGFCMGLFESWQACEDAVKGFKGAKFKSFISRDEAIFFLEENGVLVGDKTDRITARSQGARINTATSFRIPTLQSARTTQSARDTL